MHYCDDALLVHRTVLYPNIPEGINLIDKSEHIFKDITGACSFIYVCANVLFTPKMPNSKYIKNINSPNSSRDST